MSYTTHLKNQDASNYSGELKDNLTRDGQTNRKVGAALREMRDSRSTEGTSQ